MTERTFRLLEYYQKIDALLTRARTRRFADPFEIAQLKRRKLQIRNRLARLLSPPTASAGGL